MSKQIINRLRRDITKDAVSFLYPSIAGSGQSPENTRSVTNRAPTVPASAILSMNIYVFEPGLA